MKHIKVLTLGLGLIALSALATVGIANAQSFQTGNTITVAAGKTIDSMLFAGGNNIDIAGVVNGDVYCAGQNITISGEVTGDVFCAGQSITISGTVDGSVRLAGQSVVISGIIHNNASIAAQNLSIDKNSVINRDLLGGSQTTTINGLIGRDIVIGSENMTINGVVGRDINGDINTLIIGSTGQVSGKLDYTSVNNPTINNGGHVLGTTTIYAPKDTPKMSGNWIGAAILGGFIYFLVAMILIGITLALIIPQTLNEATAKAMKNPGKITLIGLLTVLATPLLVIMLFMSVIGVPLAILITLAWLIIMILNTPFVGYMLGKIIISKNTKKPFLIMPLGLSVLTIIYFIPILGFIVMFAAHVFGTGMIMAQVCTKKIAK